MQSVWRLGELGGHLEMGRARGVSTAVCPTGGTLLPSPAQMASPAGAQNTLEFCKTNQAASWGESKGGKSGLLGLPPDARHPSPAVS